MNRTEKYKEKRKQIYEENHRHEKMAKLKDKIDCNIDWWIDALMPILPKRKHEKR